MTDKELREAELLSAIGWTDLQRRKEAVRELLKVAQRQLLTELLEQKKQLGHGEFCTHCGGDFKVEAVPVAVINQKMKELT